MCVHHRWKFQTKSKLNDQPRMFSNQLVWLTVLIQYEYARIWYRVYCLSYFITSLTGAVAKYFDEYVCLWVCLSVREDISGTTCAIFTKFLCMLPVSVARSSSDMFTIGRIAYRREWVFFPIENALLAGKGGWECTAWVKYAIYDCLVLLWSYRLREGVIYCYSPVKLRNIFLRKYLFSCVFVGLRPCRHISAVFLT